MIIFFEEFKTFSMIELLRCFPKIEVSLFQIGLPDVIFNLPGQTPSKDTDAQGATFGSFG